MMETLSTLNDPHWETPTLFGSQDKSSLIRRRGAIIDSLSVQSDLEVLQSSPHVINVVLDAPGSEEVERRCHFDGYETLRDILLTVTEDYGVDLSQCQVILLTQPDMLPDFDCQAVKFANQTFLIICPARQQLYFAPRTGEECPAELSSVYQCIAYFSCCGLKPLDGKGDRPSFPKLTSMGFKSWEDLLDQETIQNFASHEEDQQIAIWELLYTEHSHLTQLAVVINTFMKCLEYIQTIDLLNEVNYHNIFGHMRELYVAHEKFWNDTLLPCLRKAADGYKPLDVNDLVDNFPQFRQLFEVYEHHCIFESQNLKALDEAMNNAEFNAYIKWCESRPECNRLRLKDFLAKPMQRLTKYPLLLKAIQNKTKVYKSKMKLQNIISMVENFVSKINSDLRYQDEVEKVKLISQKLASTCVIRDVPSGWEKYLQPYLQLDLLAPMPGVDLRQPRTLAMEGPLRYKEDATKLDAYVFLFTDMLLITRASKKSPDQLVIVKAPFRIDSLIVKPGKDSVAVDLVYLNDLKLVSSIFSLKAATPQLATVWIENIQQMQQVYYQLRCSYDSNPQLQPHQQSPMVCGAVNQSNDLYRISSLGESDFQSTCSTTESMLDRSFKSCGRKSRLSSSLSPPIISCVFAQDASTQTEDDVAVTLAVPQIDSTKLEPPKDMRIKQRFLSKVMFKRSASYEGLPAEEDKRKTERTNLSHSMSSLQRNETSDTNSPKNRKRTRSLKLIRNFSKSIK